MRRRAFTAFLCLAALCSKAGAATFTVDSTADGIDVAPGDGVCLSAGGACTLRAAVLEANALGGADAISLPAGRYALRFPGTTEEEGYRGDLDIRDDVTITGAGETSTKISGNRLDRVIDVHAPARVTLSGLTILNGAPSQDRNDPAYDRARGDGGGVLNAGTLILTDVTITRNHAAGDNGWAGGLKNLGTATLLRVTFLQNRAGDEAPGTYDEAGSVGGLWNVGAATLTSVFFRGNRGGDGDRAFGLAGDVGGMLNDGDAVLFDTMFRNNRSGDLGACCELSGSGGGMWNNGSATLSRVVFDRNRAGDGPGTYYESSDGGYGGGMMNRGMVTMTDVVFSGNRAGNGGHTGYGESCGGFGGGLYTTGRVVITNGLFDRNRAGTGYFDCPGGDGGGIFGDEVTLTNVTMTRNQAGKSTSGRPVAGYQNRGGSGGALWVSESALTNCTLAFNRAGRGLYGGLDGHGDQLVGVATMKNTIIAGSGENCANHRIISGGHNLDSGSTCGLSAATDISNAEPRLDKLKSNGGFSPTMALSPGSPAIDAGDNAACPATDQRGVIRPQGAACDVGAYEVQP